MPDDEKDPIIEIDMQDPANFAKAVDLALAASDPTGWCEYPRAWLDELPEKSGGDPGKLWAAYCEAADGPLVVAITGNGPKSRANAEFQASARRIVLGLVSEVDRLRTIVRKYEEAAT